MLGDAFEVRKAASSAGFAGGAPGRRPGQRTTGDGALSIQNPYFGVDIAKIRNLGLCPKDRGEHGTESEIFYFHNIHSKIRILNFRGCF